LRLKSRRTLPSEGELVVGDVREVYDHGAYLELLEFPGVTAYLPWSEVATRAIKNIREVLRPNLRLVVKVIRVYRGKGSVDVSLKRVMESEKRKKMVAFKRYAKAATLILGLAEKLGKSIDEAYEEAIWKLEDTYGDPLLGLEMAAIEGVKALENAKIPAEWQEQLMETIKTHIKPKTAKISGILTLKSKARDGVYRIKAVLGRIMETIKSEENIKVRVYTIGSPRYRIELEGYDYKILENTLTKILKDIELEAKKQGVEFSFERLKQ